MSFNTSSTGWLKTNLGSVIELNYGKSLPAKTRDGGEFPVFGSSGVVGNHSQALVKEPGIVVGRKGSFGEVQFSDKPFYPIDTTYYVDQFHGQPVRYWYYQLVFLPLNQLNRSTAIPGLNREDAYAQDINLPPLAEQKAIADKLDTLLGQVDSTKARLERIPEILKRFRQSVLAAAVSGQLTTEWRGNEELTGWKENELSHFIEKPRYGSSAKSQKSGDVPVLRMGNLKGGQLDWTDLVYTSDPSEIEKYRLENGDVLFNRTNSPELVGKTSIFRGEREAVYAGYLIKVKCLSSLEPEFLNYQLNSPKARSYCKAVKSDGVSQSNINAKKLAAYPLNCPPLEEQTEIVRRVDQLFAYADTVERQVNNALERVNQLTQSILAKAFRGELTAQWRAANPALISGANSAEALLERIKAERAAQAPKKRPRKKATT